MSLDFSYHCEMRRVVLLGLFAAAACGPVVSEQDSDTSPGGSTTSTATIGTTGGPSETSDSPPATTTVPEPTTTSTPPGTTSATTSSGSSSNGDSSGFLGCSADFIPPGPCEDECYRPIPGCKVDPIECSVWEQDCPDGEKCAAWANDGGDVWNATRCVPFDPEFDPQGTPCAVEGSQYSGIDSCGPAARCWDVDDEAGTGTCVALCGGSEDAPTCASGNEICLVANGGLLNVCVTRCDPLLQNCDGDQGCYAAAGGFACVPLDGGILAPEGSTCTRISDCAPGTTCANEAAACVDGGEPCCAPFCALADPTCPEGTECVDELGDAAVGLCTAVI